MVKQKNVFAAKRQKFDSTLTVAWNATPPTFVIQWLIDVKLLYDSRV